MEEARRRGGMDETSASNFEHIHDQASTTWKCRGCSPACRRGSMDEISASNFEHSHIHASTAWKCRGWTPACR